MKPANFLRPGLDLLGVLVVVALFTLLAIELELSEKIALWNLASEGLQTDELSLSIFVLTIGLTWFAFRRLNESQVGLLESERLQAQVVGLWQHNRELTQRLITAQEDEREILARELHDEIGQSCTALRIEATWLSHAKPEDWIEVLSSAERIGQISASMHSLTRNMLNRLRPNDLDTLGLVGALKALCRSWKDQYEVDCFLDHCLTSTLTDETNVAIYRIAQEALSNIARHAAATQVSVSLKSESHCLFLIVQDNGIGMQFKGEQWGGLGLLGMRERVANMGGVIEWGDARPGTYVKVTLPINS